ncbi:hypothetical protein HPG69_007669 [Diceros bicornis minor]|uniref:Uncharacterized protein n=1 Tax=Diceros bicornis minor TaxID=77932 RepID=A0A7J7EA24_DICBM|nr:hypothetical protein HPG69_007669 [Diceros bicornis minor]
MSLETLEYTTPSISPLVSKASVTESWFTQSSAFSVDPLGDLIPAPLSEPSLPAPSILLPNLMTPIDDILSPSPTDSGFCSPTRGHFVSTYHLLCLPYPFPRYQPFTRFVPMNSTDSLACHHIPPTLSVSPPPDCLLTVTQSNLISTLLKSVPENSPPDSLGGLFTGVPTIKGTDHSSLAEIQNFSILLPAGSCQVYVLCHIITLNIPHQKYRFPKILNYQTL